MKKSFNLSRGFTLVELLVVIAVIGILAVTILVNLGGARAKARDARRVSELGQIQVALEGYADANANTYPNFTNGSADAAGNWPAVGLKSALVPTYMANLPIDPTNTDNVFEYRYVTLGAGVGYQLYVELENSAAPKPAALGSDADINALGATETCTVANNDCIFDVGHN